MTIAILLGVSVLFNLFLWHRGKAWKRAAYQAHETAGINTMRLDVTFHILSLRAGIKDDQAKHDLFMKIDELSQIAKVEDRRKIIETLPIVKDRSTAKLGF